MTEKLATVIDNVQSNTLKDALCRLLPLTSQWDIATGFFEVGAFLELDGVWQSAGPIRIVMGDETTRRTRRELLAAIEQQADGHIERLKELDDSLSGLDAVRAALGSKAILPRVYSKAKFHAKLHLLHSRAGQPTNFSFVGSSNFTRPGITENLELNLFSTDQTQFSNLAAWYDAVFGEAEETAPTLSAVIDRHLREYQPFDVYAKALREFWAGRERPETDWELNDSVIYPKLSRYQQDGYHTALQMAERWGGALVCDAVGLGKTFIGLMLLERHVHDRERVLLIVPKSTRESVWERHWKRTRDNPSPLLAHISRGKYGQAFCIHNHTDFGAEHFENSRILSEADMDELVESTDVIIIDEAHHFRHPTRNRGKHLSRLAKGKKLYLMTATPINNSLDDLYHLINYFSQNRADHFRTIGINNLRRYFLDLEKRIEEDVPDKPLPEAAESEDILRADNLLKSILIQRSRRYVKESEGVGGTVLFPEKERPRVIDYSLKEVYSTIYGEIREAFDKHNPFLTLAIYNTAAYHRDPERRTAAYQMQVVGLIRTLLLKRLESSFKAFESSLESLLEKMAAFLRRHDAALYEAWATTNRRWWAIVQQHIQERLEQEEAEEEDEVPESEDGFDPADHDMEKLLGDLQSDMELLTGFLSKLYRRFYHQGEEGRVQDPTRDDKLQQLLAKLRDDSILAGNKVIIFTEFRDTARYLAKELISAEIPLVEEIDSTRNLDREQVIKRFSPYYNCTEVELARYLRDPVDVLITTDVLSEGLNLQDASLVINYDLHWNPVRLMQRIGRVDRRLDPEKEELLKRAEVLNGKIYFWNFLPPDELEDLLHLKQRLDGKILRINRTLGIEGALLTPDDPEMTLREFNERYEGTQSTEELMDLERQRLSKEHPDLWRLLPGLPKRLFSAKEPGAGFTTILDRRGEAITRVAANLTPGVFCAYRLPDPSDGVSGEVKWYYRETATGTIHEDLTPIWTAIRCAPGTPRLEGVSPASATDARRAIEDERLRPLLRDRGYPVSAKATLVCWMEVK